jgi:deoxyribonuclease-4
MPLLGAHVSTSGGVDKAPANGKGLGCDAIQVFTRNQMQWRARPLSELEIAGFREGLKECGIQTTVSHDSYLINLGSHEPVTLQKSLEHSPMRLSAAEQLGIPFLVFHPGSHVGLG